MSPTQFKPSEGDSVTVSRDACTWPECTCLGKQQCPEVHAEEARMYAEARDAVSEDEAFGRLIELGHNMPMKDWNKLGTRACRYLTQFYGYDE